MSESIDDSVDCDSKANKDSKKSTKSDFVKISGNLVSNINFKMGFFLLVLGMLIFSDLFINGVLSKMDGAVHGECTTTKGAMIQLLVFVVCYLVLDLIVKYGWL